MEIILGHGASGDARSMQPWVEALAPLGIGAEAIDLPKGKVERAVAVFATSLAANPGAAIGGHSYGGRVATMLAAERPASKLVLLSYPLHRPGHPEHLRTEHWGQIKCPVLLMSGEADPFAKIDVLSREAHKHSNFEVVTFPKVGHGLLSVRDMASQLIATFLRS